ncbi:MAG: histidine kinase [Treponema sp.]|jgi:signal transduction histidine kinase|nr:histidine kinase [Treponema sp.]
MEKRRLFFKIIPAIAIAVLLLNAGIIFTTKYTGAVLMQFFSSAETENRVLFFLNFYFPLVLCAIALYGCIFSNAFFLRAICLFVGFSMAVIAEYVLNDLFTINLCIYGAYILVTAMAFPPPYNYTGSVLSIALFTVFLFHPPFLGRAGTDLAFFAPASEQTAAFTVYLLALAILAALVRHLAESYLNSEAAVSHLNQVGTKMLLFNHRLQEYVKNSGEEAVKKDRLRFTRDLHDSSGYVFTNIIAITDAAMSWPAMEQQKMQDTFQLIQNQARQGLQQTREILHMIRKLQEPALGSIENIYEMKAILEEVTDIKVDIVSGNMRHNYGPDVNRTLTRIVQEAFTNSVRHGQASRIIIDFWEHPGKLVMVVRDNGIGTQQIVKGIGLAGMEERVAQVGGSLEVTSPEDGGFCVKVAIPLLPQELAADTGDGIA